MGLHTEYLGHLHIAPVLNADEIEFLQAFSGTRHCGDRTPLDVAEHPSDNENSGDVNADNRVSDGRPGLWCPWTSCQDGCCLIWDRVEKPYRPQEWLRYLVDTFLRPGASLSRDPSARERGLTFDHVLDGMLVGERRETGELFALTARANVVRRRVLVAGAENTDEYGYQPPDVERRSRQDRLEARRRRFAAAIARDLEAAG